MGVRYSMGIKAEKAKAFHAELKALCIRHGADIGYTVAGMSNINGFAVGFIIDGAFYPLDDGCGVNEHMEKCNEIS